MIARARALYERVGLLAIIGVVTLVAGAAVQTFTRLPGSYTWLNPFRVLRDALATPYFPSLVLVTYAVAELRRRAGGVVDVPGQVITSAWKRIAFGLGLSFAAAAVFSGPRLPIDLACLFVLGIIVGRRAPRRESAALLVGHLVFGAIVFGAICYFYSCVKALVFVGREPMDAALAGLELRVIGAYPHKLVAAYAAMHPRLVVFCDGIYFDFFQHMMLVTVLLAGLHQAKERTEYLGALACCYVIGAVLYLAIPAAGPGFYDPEAYAFLPSLPLVTNVIRADLWHNTQAIIGGKADVVETWGYIACMPSLHMAHELVMVYYSRRSRIALVASSLFCLCTLMSVVVLGWHYFVDALGAVVVVVPSIAIAKWQRDRLMPQKLAPAPDVPLAPAPFLASFRAVVRIPAGSLPEPSPRAAIVFAGIALVVRLWIALRDLSAVDRLFIPDAAYQTLAIARSMAHGVRPPASGFSPLLAFLEAPVFWLTSSLDAPVTWALVIGAVADAACVLLLARLTRRIAGPTAGVFAAAIWALSPLAIANALDGLETSLALALSLAAIELEEREILAGACAGLALFARIDTAFLVVPLVALAARKKRFKFVGVALAASAPLWIFGSIVPDDGARLMLGLHHFSIDKVLAWLGGSLSLVDFPNVRLYFSAHAALGIAVAVAVLAALAAGVRAYRVPPAFAAYALGILALYTFWRPELWFMRRYLAPAEALLAVVLACALVGRRRLVALVPLVGLALADVGAYLHGHPASAGLDRGLNGAKGFAPAVKEALALLPPDATVGAMQSGALTYFAPPSIHVVNLDGSVDPDARRALESQTILDYAFDRKLTHFADWRFNVEALGAFSANSHAAMNARPIGQAHVQGSDRITVYAFGP